MRCRIWLKPTVLSLICFLSFTAFSQVKVYDEFDDFKKSHLTSLDPDTTYVINFWATWCVPCVKELPYFEELTDKYRDRPLKVILVSLDMKDQIDSKLIPFLEKKKINSEVVVLADGRTNSWIDLIDPDWSGAIPITLVYSNNKKIFYEKSYESFEELEKEIKIQ